MPPETGPEDRVGGPRSGLPRPAAEQSGPERSAAPRARRPTGFLVRWLVFGGGLLALGGLAVIVARSLMTLEPVRDFVEIYPGQTAIAEGTPVGIPAWLGWQHFLNGFFLVLIVKTGWQVRTQRRAPAMWTRDNTGLIRTREAPRKISITLWLHLSLDVLWLLNGITFVILLFATGHWLRVVPTTWDVFPNAVSAALQYASLDWPTENGWVAYNSLQVLAYFVTIFVAAPLAAASGFRMSAAWSSRWRRLSVAYPIAVARAVHVPVMVYFVAFSVVHISLVLATGALRNLNHMYAGQDVVNWWGAAIFGLSLLATSAAWVLARPAIVSPIAALLGRVSSS